MRGFLGRFFLSLSLSLSSLALLLARCPRPLFSVSCSVQDLCLASDQTLVLRDINTWVNITTDNVSWLSAEPSSDAHLCGSVPFLALPWKKKWPTGRENSLKIHGNKKTEYRVKKLKVGTFDADDQFQETNKQTNKQNRRQRRRQENEAESSIRKNFLELVWRLSFFFFYKAVRSLASDFSALEPFHRAANDAHPSPSFFFCFSISISVFFVCVCVGLPFLSFSG